MTKQQILEAASLKYGRRFATLREIEIFLAKHEQRCEEVSVEDNFALGFAAQKPYHFDDAANCVGEHSDEVRDACMQYGIRTLLTLTESNTLYRKKEAEKHPATIAIFDNGQQIAEIWL